MRGLVAGVWLLTAAAGCAGEELPLGRFDRLFTPREAPVRMDYDLGYRLMNIELSRVASVTATTTIGLWRHRVTGADVPALLLDMRVDSPDLAKGGRRSRISIHDRILAVVTVPDMQALLFAKYTDEYLRPLIHASEARGESVYDTQSGRLEYEHRNLRTGAVSTNLANPEALLELSRRVRPVMMFLVSQYKSPDREAAKDDACRIVANLDGKVASLRLLTRRERSPCCLTRQRFDSMCIRTAAERGSAVSPRDFRAWSMLFADLAALTGDAALVESARHAPVETVVPLIMDYELALGRVRATMTGIRVGADAVPGHPLVVTKGPGPVAEK